ncbi:MAG: TlpA family protein disulfide reductase [Gammaproteobacteria bacterium]|nr:TlpA family protein disulfide reductase [Gammaproteobacteria bacterium]
MKKTRLIGIGLIIAILSGVIGFKVHRSFQADTNQTNTNVTISRSGTDIIGRLRPEFSLPDMNGAMHNVTEWDGKVVAINFWATWCPPCRDEIPEFIKLQEKFADQGLQFIGIALQQARDVREFATTLGINYPILVGEEEVIDVATQYGNYFGALPYTVIINRESHIAFIKPGPLQAADAERVITSLL